MSEWGVKPEEKNKTSSFKTFRSTFVKKEASFKVNVVLPTDVAGTVNPNPEKKEGMKRAQSFVERAHKITVEEVEAALQQLKDEDRMLVRPDHPYLQNWDFCIFLALIFTALITPFEVAFVETEIGPLFFVNRFVDSLFITDMILQFFLMYHHENGRLVKSHTKIRNRYLKGWFTIDFLTVIPFDMAKWLLSSSKVKIIRIIRLLRLFKLLRIVRASRIFTRWETKLGIDHGTMMYVKLFCTLTLLTHWFACIWGLFMLIESPDDYTWMSKWLDNRFDTPDHCKTGYDVDTPINGGYREGCWQQAKTYLACFQLAVMTITGSGPGGGIEPVNVSENVLISILILITGVQWANIIGQICSIAASGDPVAQRFYQIGDDLNRLMRETNIDTGLRQHIRLYLRHSKTAMRESSRKTILSNLSPELSGQMATKGHRWIKEKMVFWVSACSPTFLSLLIIKMTCEAFAPKEIIPANACMYVLRKGTCMTSRLMMKSSLNTCWNVDFVLTSPVMQNMRSMVPGRTLSFVEVDVLSLQVFQEVMDAGFPEAPAVTQRIRWWAVLRLMQYGARLKTIGKMPTFQKHLAEAAKKNRLIMPKFPTTVVEPAAPSESTRSPSPSPKSSPSGNYASQAQSAELATLRLENAQLRANQLQLEAHWAAGGSRAASQEQVVVEAVRLVLARMSKQDENELLGDEEHELMDEISPGP